MYRVADYLTDPAAAGELRASLRTGRPAKLRSAKLKLTSRCNLRCQMCRYWRSEAPDRIDGARALAVLDQLGTLGCLKVHLSGGEILTRPDAAELVAAAGARGMRATITTNATLVDRSLARDLVRAGLRGATVSLDSAAPRVHDRMRGVKGAFSRALRGLGFLSEARAHLGGHLKLRVNAVVTRLNWEGLADLPAALEGLSIDQLLLIPVDEKRSHRLGLTRQMIRSYNDAVAPELAARGLEVGVFRSSEEAYPFGHSADDASQAAEGRYARGFYDRHLCFAPWTHLFAAPDGEVFFCCMARNRMAPLGSLAASSVADVFGGEAYRAARGAFLRGPLDVCASCDSFIADNRALAPLAEAWGLARRGASDDAAVDCDGEGACDGEAACDGDDHEHEADAPCDPGPVEKP